MSEKTVNKKKYSVKAWIVAIISGVVFLLPIILIIFTIVFDALPEESGVIERWGQSLIVWLLFMGLFGLIWKVIEKIRDEIDLKGVSNALFSSILKTLSLTIVLTLWMILVKWISNFEIFKTNATALTLGFVILLLISLMILGVNLWKKKQRQ